MSWKYEEQKTPVSRMCNNEQSQVAKESIKFSFKGDKTTQQA